MNKQASFNLDLLRWIAALAVFLFHVSYLCYEYPGPRILAPLGRFGVVFFFVLSGYVIAHVTATKHHAFDDYIIARIARLYSVFIPALVLTILCDICGRQLNVDLYREVPSPFSTRSYLATPFFLSFLYENSYFSLRWFTNGPAWSIAHEFWYYVIFGIAFYTSGLRRIVILAIACFVAGTAILALFPCWLAGVAIYRQQAAVRKLVESRRTVILLVSTALIFLACIPAFDSFVHPLENLGVGFVRPGMQSRFVLDYIYALLASLLVAALTAWPPGEIPCSVQRFVKWGAGSSFSLYLFHVPLLFLIRSTRLYDPHSIPQSAVAAAVVLTTTFGLSLFTERKKALWVKWVTLLINGSLSRRLFHDRQRV